MTTRDLIGGFVAWGLITAILVAWIASVIWAYRDARRRNKSGLLVALIVIMLPWPAGLLAWLAFRPSRHHGPPPRFRRA